MQDPFKRPTFVPALFYPDMREALDWLERAFGFRRSMVITAPDGKIVHSEMKFAGGLIMVGESWADHTATPAEIGDRNTQSLHVHLDEDVDAHCARAKAAGAAILREPTDEFYGDRTYLARDLGGHVWNFGQTRKIVSREEAENASGLKIEGWVEG